MSSALPAVIASPRGLTVEGASAALLAELLHDLEAELRKQNVAVDRLRRAPTSAEVVRAEFSTIGLTAPDEAITLFGWCDGFEESGSILVLPVFEAIPLVAVTMSFNRARLGLGEWDWNPNWVQVMGGKYGLGMCCADEPDQPPLIRFVEDQWRTQAWQTEYQVVSLCTPVRWWIEGLRRGWYLYDPSSGAWDRDPRRVPQHIGMYEMT